MRAAELETEQALMTHHAVQQQQQQDVVGSGSIGGRSSTDIAGVAYDKVTLAQSAIPVAAEDIVPPSPVLAGTSGVTGGQLVPEMSPAVGGTSGDVGAGTYSDTLNVGDQGFGVTTADMGGTSSDTPTAAAAAGVPAGPRNSTEFESPRAKFQAIKAKFERAHVQDQQQQQASPGQSPSRKLKKGKPFGSVCFVF